MRTETAYTVVPAGKARATVLVLHTWWGLTPVITRVCDTLATLGYVSVAPDLYRGEVATTTEQALALRAGRRRTPVWRQLVAELERARAHAPGEAVGQVGFSMGGHWALWMAARSQPQVPPIAATAVFCAVRAGDVSAGRSAVQLHLAETDPYVTHAGVARTVRGLQAAGREVEVHRYPGTGHWFFDRDRPEEHDPAAAALAWQRTVAFLGRHLAGPGAVSDGPRSPLG
ncbi:dienelactone hydrolase family protein [Actinotalea sp.]|uniref:dienelactone hydrolase family protein n=1 Tax=Actinotalea sp. TaxID=1872145 RepID=UPI003564C357